MISSKVMKSQLELGQLNFINFEIKKGTGKKRRIGIKRNRLFQIALKGAGGNGNFAWVNFNHSMLLSY